LEGAYVKSLTDSPTWVTIETSEITDPWGPAIIQYTIQQLTDRTKYLYDEIAALGGAGTSAPVSGAYVCIGNNATLTSERALTAGTGITITDNGANSTVVIALAASAEASIEALVSTAESSRVSSDVSLTTRVSESESTTTSADTSLTTRVSTEESTGLSLNASLASTGLSQNASLESVALSADSSLTSRLSTEESTRASAVASVAAVARAPTCYNVTRTTAVTLGSSMARVTDMVLTPAAGTYLVIAHARVKLTASDGAGICIAYDGTFVPVTLHTYPNWDSYGCYEHNWCAQCVITCDGAKVVEVHAKYNNSSGPTVEECGLSALKVTAV
jgi:hypothetical protein